MPIRVADLASRLTTTACNGLVDAKALDRVYQLVPLLPEVSGGMSLECHLGRGGSRADVVIRVLQRDRGELLQCGATELEPGRRFAERWAVASELGNVPYVDLEFDLDGSDRACFVGAMIEPSLHRGMSAVPRARQASRLIGVSSSFRMAEAVLLAAEPSPVDARILEGIHHAFDALPHAGVIGHLGSLKCRQSDQADLVRLIVSLPRRAVPTYLQVLSWPGDLCALLDAVARYLGPKETRVDLDLNFTSAGLAPETGFYRSIWRPGDDEVAGVASQLLASELATVTQAQAVTRASCMDTPADGMPWTMTFKIKIDARSRIVAKVYLSLLRNG